MGRTKYTPEARNAVMASFVLATREIIGADGVNAASIRRISTSTGYSSATLYLYFDDVSELVTMSLISYLSDYVRDIIVSTPDDEESPEAMYRRTWRLFCEHAFSNPLIFTELFFGPKRDDLDSIAKKYYELFPDELEKATGVMLDMLKQGNLFERNRVVIASLANRIGLSDHELDIANDLTISYFHHFLDIAAIEHPGIERREELIDQFLEGAFFVLRD